MQMQLQLQCQIKQFQVLNGVICYIIKTKLLKNNNLVQSKYLECLISKYYNLSIDNVKYNLY